jgi:hypothetical protein
LEDFHGDDAAADRMKELKVPDYPGGIASTRPRADPRRPRRGQIKP